ncbi:hypothetical protein [Fructobacillus cardui]|uniref:HIRAN domain-containing protein n=1 Tax=Fructobacillus cardui TaxID=2893170 RepID=A0ABM9MQC7_9LACO|nr:unnamed protein product [Fructobacillus cardui]
MPFIYLLILLIILFFVISFIFSFWGILLMFILGVFFLIRYLSPEQKEKRKLKKENNEKESSQKIIDESINNIDDSTIKHEEKIKILGFDESDHLEPSSYVPPKKETLNKQQVKVVGTTYTNAKQILRNVVKDEGGIWNTGGYTEHNIFLSLVPDPKNKVDPDAIAVYSRYETPERARISRSGRIGYLPKGISLKLDEETIVKAKIKEGYGNFGVTVDLSKLPFNND